MGGVKETLVRDGMGDFVNVSHFCDTFLIVLERGARAQAVHLLKLEPQILWLIMRIIPLSTAGS